MEQTNGVDLTALIDQARAGGSAARDRLFRAIYEQFHRIAVALMSHERSGHTLQPSALVNEAVIRLINGHVVERSPNRRYLIGAATRAMRQVLVDHYRSRRAREDRLERVPLDEAITYFEEKNLDLEALNQALDRLSAMNERQGLVVALRFFAGLTVAEVADALECSVSTVELDWRFARAWLRDQIEGVD